MSKWKCGICNTGFDNYQAQGFDGVIYCPLCYFKELYKREKELGEHYKNLYSEVKKQKDDVVELIIKLYQKEYNKTSDWWLQEELCNNFDDMNIFTDFELERMLGEIDD